MGAEKIKRDKALEVLQKIHNRKKDIMLEMSWKKVQEKKPKVSPSSARGIHERLYIMHLLETIHTQLPLERINNTLAKEPLHNDLLEGTRVVHFEGFATTLLSQEAAYGRNHSKDIFAEQD